MKILITGAGGFLGSRLAAYYEKKYEVWAPSHAELDFTSGPSVAEAFCRFCPDVVLHCGAISDVGVCEKNPELSRAVNVLGTQLLARASRKAGSRFIYCSSDQVYFAEQEEAESDAEYLRPRREDLVLKPVPLYGQHKLEAERLAFLEQPDTIALRLTWMYDRLTEAELQKGRRNLLTMLSAAMESNETLIFSPTDHRGITDVREVVRNMEALWKLPAGVYNFGSPNGMDMYAMVHQVLSAFGKEHLLQKASGGRLRNLAMDMGKLEAEGIFFSRSDARLVQALKEMQGQI